MALPAVVFGMMGLVYGLCHWIFYTSGVRAGSAWWGMKPAEHVQNTKTSRWKRKRRTTSHVQHFVDFDTNEQAITYARGLLKKWKCKQISIFLNCERIYNVLKDGTVIAVKDDGGK